MVCVRLEGNHFHLCTRRILAALNATGYAANSTYSSAHHHHHRIRSGGEGDFMAEQPGAAVGSSNVCPPPSSASSGPCVVQCRSQSDCQADQACCSNGCGYTCVSTTPSQVTKPGSCPLTFRILAREGCGSPCVTDGDCRGRQKCCRTARCGAACVAPCFHWRASTRLNPWRLSSRCSASMAQIWH
ncbi:hypothetical protein ACOMHN_007348 [Nucella lapillus]